MAMIPKGFTYETIEVGQRATGLARTITEADHGLFMMLTGAWHPIHCDEEYAKGTPMGRRIVQGTFGIALSLGNLEAGLLESSDPLVGALGIVDWSYKAPIFIGDTLHIEIEIACKSLTSKGDRYIIDRGISLINQEGTVVQQGTARSMWQKAAR
jgi:acyl dehydratase